MLSPDNNRLVLGGVALLFAAVTVIRFEFGSVGDGYTLLYVLPIALAALQFGLGGGLAASALAIALVVVWTQADDVGLSAVGYLTRSLAFVVLGGLVGFETRQLRRAEREREDLLARVEAMARTDGLTGLANRRAWDDALRLEIERARRADASFVVALLDLDHFKKYNDEHGHPAGDELLRQAADSWRAQVRVVDTVARYGGEEFALLLPGSSQSAAADLFERLRAVTPLGQTISAGIAEWDGQESAEALVERADKALYEAKRGGRDRCSVAIAA